MLRFEALVSVGNGALAVALVAAVLSAIGALVAFRKVPAVLAVVAALAACCALSAGASSYDHLSSTSLRHSLNPDLRWVDHAHLGAVDLLAPPGARKEQSWEQLFWNTSVRRLLLLGSPPLDQFDTKLVRVSPDGRILINGRTDRRPLLVQTYASTVQMTGVKRVRRDVIFDLYRPSGTPRLRLVAAGRFPDKWLSPRGAITVWTKTPGTLTLVVTMPRGTQVTPVHFNGRLVQVRPGKRTTLRFHVPGNGAWSLHFHSKSQGYIGDRAVAVLAPVVQFH